MIHDKDPIRWESERVERKWAIGALLLLVACGGNTPQATGEAGAGSGGENSAGAPGGSTAGDGQAGSKDANAGGNGGLGLAGETGAGGRAGAGGSAGGSTSAGGSAGDFGGGAGTSGSGGASGSAGTGASGASGGNAGAAGSAGAGGTTSTLLGAAQKGPMLSGSDVRVALIDAQGNSNGTVYSTITSDDEGHFTVANVQSGGADLSASGFYFNEISGNLSGAPITLHALTQISAAVTSQPAFINVLTHMAANRVRALLGQGSALPAATAQAEAELRSGLGIFSPGAASGTTLDVTGSDNANNAYLLALSCVLGQAAIDSATSAAEVDAKLQQLVNQVAADLGPDGAIGATLQATIQTAARELDVLQCSGHLQDHLVELGSSALVPDIRRALDWDGDGISDYADPDADGDGLSGANDLPLAASLSAANTNFSAALTDRSGNLWVWPFSYTFVGGLRETLHGPQSVLRGVVRAAQTSDSTYTLKADGTLWWSGPGFTAPSQIASGLATTPGALVAQPSYHAFAVKTDGTALWFAGNTIYPMTGLSNVKRVAAVGDSRSLGPVVIQNDGTASLVSQETDALNNLHFVPTPIDLGDVADAVGGPNYDGFVLNTAGEVYRFPTTNLDPGATTIPTQRVGGLPTMSELVGVLANSLVFGIDTQGRLWSWRDLFPPPTDSDFQAALVPELSQVVAAAVNDTLLIAAKDDGSVWWYPFTYSGSTGYVPGAGHRVHVPH